MADVLIKTFFPTVFFELKRAAKMIKNDFFKKDRVPT